MKYRMWSPGLWRPVVLYVLTNVSTERFTSFFTSALKVEAICSSETMVIIYNATQRHDPEDHKPQFYRRENLNFHYIKYISLIPC